MEYLRHEYLDYMKSRKVDRPMFVELFGPLVGLEEEWRSQGAADAEIGLTAFGFDYVRKHSVGVNTGIRDYFEEGIEEETSEYVIKRDRKGRRTKLVKRSATIALPMGYPVESQDDWAGYRPLYQYHADRFSAGWQEAARAARDAGALIRVTTPGGFDEVRELMGDENACLAFYTDPQLAKDILDTIAECVVRIIKEVAAVVPIDQLSVHEDLAGKSGPLIGPNIMDEFVVPYYRRVWDAARAAGAEIFQMDSDGNINPIMDSFIAGGVNSFLPLEPAAGMDMVAVREKYGRDIALVGGIDKFALLGTKADIDRELDYKLDAKMQSGGVVFGLDHRIPNGVHIENYRYYVKRSREMLGLPTSPAPGWERMAM
jgi:hypothetical protein